MVRPAPPAADLHLPNALSAFLTAHQPLAYTRYDGERVLISPRPTAELAAEELPVPAGRCEPFEPDRWGIEINPGPVVGVHVATISGEDYGPVTFLYWLPGVPCLGLREETNGPVRVYRPEVTWEQFAADPNRHLHPGPVGELRVRPEAGERGTPGDFRPGVSRAAISMFRTMKGWRRRDWLAFNLGLFLSVVVALLYLTSPPPAISPESYERIELGMSMREADRIVNAQTGWYGPAYLLNPPFDKYVRLSEGVEDCNRRDLWEDNVGTLEVGYDSDGRVCWKRLSYNPNVVANHPENLSLLERLLDRRRPRKHPPAYIYTQF